jgi:hypothetical protein
MLPLMALALIGADQPPKRKPVSTPQPTPTAAPARDLDQPGTTMLDLLPIATTPDGAVIFYDERSRKNYDYSKGTISYRILSLFPKPVMASGEKTIGFWSHMVTNCKEGLVQQEKMTTVKGPETILNGTPKAAVTNNLVAPAGSLSAAINRIACENAPPIYSGNRFRTLAAANAFVASPEKTALKPLPAFAAYPKAPSGKAQLLKIRSSGELRTEDEYFQAGVTSSFVDMGSMERFGDHAVVWRLYISSPASYLVGGDAYQAKNGYSGWQRLWVDCSAGQRRALGWIYLGPDLKPGNYGLSAEEPLKNSNMDERFHETLPIGHICSKAARPVLPAAVDIDQTIRTERARLESEAKALREARK